MIVVVEGPDNAGKSTLIKCIAGGFPSWTTQKSEGPALSTDEINSRIERYLAMDRVFFDRFPAISNPIYDTACQRKSYLINPALIAKLYARKPLFIYCDPLERGLAGHVTRDGVDTEEHLRQVARGHNMLLKLYRQWAIEHAHVIYRIGDNMTLIADFIEKAVYRNGSAT